MRNVRVKKLTLTAMLCAIAYAVMAVGRIPVVMFLSYDPKDVIICIGGFLMGPVAAFVVSAVVSLVEMATVSTTGPIGLVMNIISSCAFACTASLIYRKKRSMGGAVFGLAAGCAAMTVVMLLWNYLVTPIYMGYPREAVAALLIPVFLPFNLLKGGLNFAVTLLLYKPASVALRRAGLLLSGEPDERKSSAAEMKKPWRPNVGMLLFALLFLATCILLLLVFKGVI